MSDPSLTTTHSLRGEATQVTLIPDSLKPHAHRFLSAERQAKLLADYEELLRSEARLEENAKDQLTERKIQKLLRAAKGLLAVLPAPHTTADLWPRTIGRTQVWQGQARQQNKSLESRWFATAADYEGWLRATSAIGEKGTGPCAYDAIFLVQGRPKKWNCVAITTITIDLDSEIVEGELVAALATPEDVAKADAWVASKGGHVCLTTSSHNPKGNGRICRKYQIPCEPISYKERYEFGALIQEELAAELGITRGSKRRNKIDPIIQRGVQLQHGVRWADQARADQAELFTVEGPALNFDRYRGVIAERKRQEDERARQEEEARQAMRGAGPVADLSEVVDNTDLDQKLLRAEELLRRLGPAIEGQGGDTQIFRAITIGKKCGLSATEFWPILEAWNSTCSPPWSVADLAAKLERGYRSSHAVEGSALRTIASRSTWEAVHRVVELDLGGPTFSVNSDLEKSETASIENKPPVNEGWLGGVANPSKLTTLHTPALPALKWEDLAHRLTIVDSPCGTQKTRAYTPLVHELVAQGKRVVVAVPSQSLSIDLARRLGIQSHLDPTIDWTGSLVTCIHSLHKVQRFSTPTTNGIELVDLDDVRPIQEHPIALLVWDEFGELNDCRTDSLIAGARRCDSIHKAAQDLCQDASRILACQAHSEVEDIECIVHDWLGWKGKNATLADWELISNDFHVLRPDIFVGGSRERVRKEQLKAHRRGARICTACSTVMDCELESVTFAVMAMSSKAGFDVGPFCGPGYRDALEPADQLPELCEELGKRGLVLEQVRPRVLRINSQRHDDEVQALLADPTGEAMKWDAIFYTATIQSGFSIYLPMAVFAFLRAGAGPVANGIHQMLCRCRLPVENQIHVSIEGSARKRSGDPEWWYRHLTRWSGETAALLDGVTSYRLERAEDGTVYLVDFNEELVRAEAKRLARYHRRANIEDIRDAMGRVTEPGALTGFWKKIGLNVIYMYETEMQDSLGRLVEDEKKAKAEEDQRRQDIRQGQQIKIVKAPKKPKSETDKLKKERRRTPEIHAMIENADLRWRYGLEELTVEDVEWDRKNRKRCSLFAVVAAMRQDPRKVVENQAEWEGPIKVHQRHRAARGAQLIAWLDALGISDLDAAASAATVLPSFGAYLATRPLEREIAEVDFGLVWTPDDVTGTRLTVSLLRLIGLKTRRGKKRKGKGQRDNVRVLDPASLVEMQDRSKAAVERLLDPEQAKEQWAEIEARSFCKHPRINIEQILAGIMAAEDFRRVA
ncbi:hypothetical protein OV203_26120 [Nannocystis sp. ILAH1]|uniref:hypothetical protein n=1 Tax=Nannocystis sp. ILAH1 TaxID=2996789 RepID=UPI00226DA943|nr:hypothetical protein [Nannocystis sp. ILAH1]MCY0990647.1 hypothetical protein [Nannocystis sp. ILAH1]